MDFSIRTSNVRVCQFHHPPDDAETRLYHCRSPLPRSQGHSGWHNTPMATPEELNKTGMEHYKAGRFAEAVAAYEEAVSARPEYAPCWLNLTYAYNKLNRPDDAVRAAQRGVALAPQVAAAHSCLAAAQVGKGRWNEAVSEYMRAYELDRAQFAGLATAGHLCMDHGITPKAIEIWTMYLAAAPADHPRRAEVEGEVRGASGGPGLISKF